MLQPGTIITDIEGVDLGPQGAVVVEVDGDSVELALLDTREFVTVDLSKVDFAAEEPIEPEGVTPSGYDPEALDSPELHSIRWLPTYWGPRDTNNPSTLTDVSWRPEPYWRRMQNRYYQVGPNANRPGDIRMTYKKRPMRRKALRPTDPNLDTSGVIDLGDGMFKFDPTAKWDVEISGPGRPHQSDMTGNIGGDRLDFSTIEVDDDGETLSLLGFVSSHGEFDAQYTPPEDYIAAMLLEVVDSLGNGDSVTIDVKPHTYGGNYQTKWTASAHHAARRMQNRYYQVGPNANQPGDDMQIKKRPMRRRAARPYGYVLVDDREHEFYGFGRSCEEAVDDAVEFYRDNPDYRPMDREDLEELSCYPASREFYEDPWGDDFVIDHGVAMLAWESDSYLDALENEDAYDIPSRFGRVRRSAEPLPSMDPVPHRKQLPKEYREDYDLPRRMRLERWEEPEGAALDTEVLIALTIDFWKQYRQKRMTYTPTMGNHESLSLKDWGLIFMNDTGLERAEMLLLYDFMVATDLIPQSERTDFDGVLDGYVITRFDRISE